MASSKPRVGAPVERLDFPTVDQDGSISIGGPKDRWTMLFVYRGRHCPRCKRFLNKLNDALPEWVAAMDVVVVSADSREKALTDREEFGWKFDLCYGLTEAQMRSLDLFVSEPLSDAETTGPCLLNPVHLQFARTERSCLPTFPTDLLRVLTWKSFWTA